MFALPNPYVLAAGGVTVLGVAASLFLQSQQIHHYHKLYNCVNVGEDCAKSYKGDTLPSLRGQIKTMTDTQNNQTGKSDQTVIRVVQGPERVQSIIREIHDAPANGPCAAPVYKEDVTNAF
jgi:hypothetical protein